MNKLRIVLAVAVVAVAVLALGAAPSGAAPASQVPTPTMNEINEVARDLWCPLCNGVRLDNCELQACIQMKEVIAQKLVAGETLRVGEGAARVGMSLARPVPGCQVCQWRQAVEMSGQDRDGPCCQDACRRCPDRRPGLCSHDAVDAQALQDQGHQGYGQKAAEEDAEV